MLVDRLPGDAKVRGSDFADILWVLSQMFQNEPADILAVAFSPGGKKVAVTRARANNSDVVMFSNFR